MSTPGRRTRSRRGTPDSQNDTGSQAGTDAPTPRRSARLGSTDRATPLPTVPTRDSRAYGGSGRRDFSDEIEHVTDFNQALDAIRGSVNSNAQLQSEARDADETGSRARESSAPLSEVSESGAGTRRRPGRPRRAPELEAIEEVLTPRNDRTSVGPSKAQSQSPSARSARNAAVGEGTTMLNNPIEYRHSEATASTASSHDLSGSSQSGTAPRFRITDLIDSVLDQIRHLLSIGRDAISHWYHNTDLINFRSMLKILLYLLPLLFAVGFWRFMSVPAHPHPIPSITNDPLGAFKHYRDVATASVVSWTGGSSDGVAYQYPWALDGRVTQLENQVGSLTATRKLHDTSIQKLHDVLPDHIFLRSKDGVLQFPDGFFEAMKERFDPLYTPKDFVPAWDAFVGSNSYDINRFFQESAEAFMAGQLENEHVLSVEKFIDMMNNEFSTMYTNSYNLLKSQQDDQVAKLTAYVDDRDDRLIAQIDNQYDEMHAKLVDFNWEDSPRMQISIKKAIALVSNGLPDWELHRFSVWKLLGNRYLEFDAINFFSPRLGAVVDTRLTSPTMKRQIGWLQAIYDRTMGIRNHNPPVAALEPWEEAGDCWCAAPPKNETPNNEAEGGSRNSTTNSLLPPRAQIAVILPRAIYPARIIVDHIPFRATLDPFAAPETLELWVEIKDNSQRKTLEDWSAETYGLWYGRRTSNHREGEPLPKTFVLLLVWNYGIFDENHIQARDIPVMWHRGERVAVDKVIVRAVTNRDQKYTCFYRLRLHGQPVVDPSCTIGGPECEVARERISP